jgi:uncharacterized protein YegP (UPF0339 family)
VGVSYFQIFTDHVRQYRWRFVASNGKTIAVSSESYLRKSDCEHSIALIKRDGPAAPVI